MTKRRKGGSLSRKRKNGKRNYTKKETDEQIRVAEANAEKANAPEECPAVSPLPNISKAPPSAAARERSKENNVNYDERDQTLGKKLFTPTARRVMIGGYFVFKHGMEQDETKWGCKGGIISDIKKVFDIPQGTEISYILRAVIMCHELGLEYDGSTITERTGRIPILDIHSEEGTIAANNLERGVGRPLIHMLVNDHRMQNELPSVTLSSVKGLIDRMKPKEKKINKRPQGSYDVTSRICRARYLFALQIALRVGLACAAIWVKDYCTEYNAKHNLPEDHVPSYLRFAKDNEEGEPGKDFCTSFEMEEVAFFDETHRKACPGTADKTSVAIMASTTSVYQVPKDKNGRIDPENGTIEEKDISQSYVKYTQEGRFCLGVCIDKVVDSEGNVSYTGKRLTLFDYTGKILLSPDDFDALIAKEILCVKNLKAGGQWVETINKDLIKHPLYMDDPVTKLKGVGKVTSELLHTNGIYSIEDLINLQGTAMERIENVPHHKIHGWIDAAKEILNLRPADELLRPELSKIDHRKADNPYQSRYGDNWLDNIKLTRQLSAHGDIRDLVLHIVDVTKAAGKKYFYHDALSLMTCKKTMAWMKKEGYLKMWIRPQAGLFEDDSELKRFWGRVVGNSPELMLLDKRLNKDLHEAVNQHYILTNDLLKEDPRRFGMETPRQVASSYIRVWDPSTGVAPSSKRIVQDFIAVFHDAVPRIIGGKGICLDDNAISGRRNERKRKRSEKWGGKRKRKLALDNYGTYELHEDAKYGVKVKLEIAKGDHKKLVELQRKQLSESQCDILGESTADALGYEVNEEGDEIVHVDRDAEIGGAEEVSTLRENQ